jgi:hypothetical protein
MNNVYNDTTHEEKSQIQVEEMVVDHTTPEEVLMAWQEMQALRKKEEVPAMEWAEFLNWMTGR